MPVAGCSSAGDQLPGAAEQISDKNAATSASEEEPCRQADQQEQQQEQREHATGHQQSQKPAGSPLSSGRPLTSSVARRADSLLAAQPGSTFEAGTARLLSQSTRAGSINIRRISSQAVVLLRAPSGCQLADDTAASGSGCA